MATIDKSITVVIATYNEEKNIVECIKSARLLTENILVVDTQSIDKTAELAKKAGGFVIDFPHRRFVEPVRKFSIEKTQTEWVFVLDADERITPELSKEIHDIIGHTHVTHFKLPRKNIFARKQWLKFGGWYPDPVIRFIKKSAFEDWPDRIHSTPQISGEMGFLKSSLEHYFHSSLDEMVEKTVLYEDIESSLLYEAGHSASVPTFFRKYLGELWRRLFLYMGFRDGVYGIIESIYQAYSKTITYLMLYEKKKNTHL